MGRECDVVHGGKRVIGSQRVEHVKAIPDGGMLRIHETSAFPD
jgi:hypothetical protein